MLTEGNQSLVSQRTSSFDGRKSLASARTRAGIRESAPPRDAQLYAAVQRVEGRHLGLQDRHPERCELGLVVLYRPSRSVFVRILKIIR